MSDENKQVVFYEFFQPPLESGDYIVTVQQQASGASGTSNAFDETFINNITFAVQGVRFSIPPSYIQSQFPPLGTQGEYGNVLPNIVFTPRTLPWQRDLGLTPPENAQSLQYPWLALLVFDETDPAPIVISGTLDNLLNPPSNTASYPNLTLEYGQQSEDPCNYIDVPVDLFNTIAPKSTEVRWLAHARILDDQLITRKALGAAETITGETSIVVGNRLAKAGHKTTCCLVSLEDMGTYLPDQEGPPQGKDYIRLATLSSWIFSSVEEPVTFRDYFMNLNCSPSTLQVPYANVNGTANPDVQQALEMGFTALPHHTRQAADLVSWYRGPLLPFIESGEVEVPATSQDALTCYNPDTGMMDISLSSAWQLGRLLALNDLEFSTTLYNWKRSQQQAAINEFEQQFIGEQLSMSMPVSRLHASEFYRLLMKDAVRPTLLNAFKQLNRNTEEENKKVKG